MHRDFFINILDFIKKNNCSILAKKFIISKYTLTKI